MPEIVVWIRATCIRYKPVHALCARNTAGIEHEAKLNDKWIGERKVKRDRPIRVHTELDAFNRFRG